jgi:hypothetical protein
MPLAPKGACRLIRKATSVGIRLEGTRTGLYTLRESLNSGRPKKTGRNAARLDGIAIDARSRASWRRKPI